MNYRSVLRSLPFFVTLPILCVLVLDGVTAWPKHGPDESLLAPATAFPVAWGTRGQRTDVQQWQEGVYAPFGVLSPAIVDPTLHHSWLGGLWYTAQSWQAVGQSNGPVIRQDLKAFDRSPLQAAIKLRQVDTGDTTMWQDVPFSTAVRKQVVDLDPMIARNLQASEYRTVCAVGSLTQCEMWYTWLRYGQYILQINVTVPQRSMDVRTFSTLVGNIDAHVARELARTE